MKVVVIVPTYNEKENIAKLVPQMAQAFKQNKIDGRILIVDDNSPDGTGREAEALARKYPVSVLHRKEKAGLGAAYIAGFWDCLEKGADVICEMDADLSHNPKHFPEIIRAINGADVVLGSRYIPGGGTVNWGLKRQLISRNANRLARTMTGVPVNDMTGGYRAYKAKVLRSISLDNVRSSGYAFQVELLYRAFQRGYRIKEVPIVFRERERGISKLSRTDIICFFTLCLKLGLQRIYIREGKKE